MVGYGAEVSGPRRGERAGVGAGGPCAVVVAVLLLPRVWCGAVSAHNGAVFLSPARGVLLFLFSLCPCRALPRPPGCRQFPWAVIPARRVGLGVGPPLCGPCMSFEILYHIKVLPGDVAP